MNFILYSREKSVPVFIEFMTHAGANLRKTIIYNTNIDLVNDDVYTKFCLILSIRSQDIE